MTILILGSKGLVGSAVCRNLTNNGKDYIAVSRADADLKDFNQVNELFKRIKPTVIICGAAKVGGMLANKTYPVEFLLENLILQNNILQNAYNHQVNKLVFLGSSCIYPAQAKQPISEDSLLTGLLEKTNEAYAIAKIAGLKLVQSYRSEYGMKWISVMPTNLYGPGDNYDLNNSHVLAAFIRKFYDAKKSSVESIQLWGSGNPRREFMYVDDFASALVHVLENYESSEPINIGTGEDISIKELANMMCEISGYTGKVNWDTSIQDGTYQKLLNIDKLKALGWKPEISLIDGISSTYEWFKQHNKNSRLDVQV
jgi:GDP-L-fucose synthase